MSDLKKLADALAAVRHLADYGRPGTRDVEQAALRAAIDGAESILRAADVADVGELIELAAKPIYDQWADQNGWIKWVPGGNSLNQDEARKIARSALESALRLLVARVPQAAPEGDVTNAERMHFLHTSNEDEEGYEYGVARVKWGNAIEETSILWTASDHSDIDAIIRKQRACTHRFASFNGNPNYRCNLCGMFESASPAPKEAETS